MAEDHKGSSCCGPPAQPAPLHYRLEPGVSFMVYRHSLMSHNPIHAILSVAGDRPVGHWRLVRALRIS